MRYVIDTYNLIHAAAAMGGPLSGMTVRKLCQYLSAAPVTTKATLVLDGRAKPDEPSPNEFPDITLTYSGAGVKADVVIAQLVERAANRRKLTVVSNDGEVARHARGHHVRVMNCEEFMNQLTRHNPRASADAMPPKKVAGTPTTGEADLWMEEFGVKPEDAKSAEPPPQQEQVEGINIEDLLGKREEL